MDVAGGYWVQLWQSWSWSFPLKYPQEASRRGSVLTHPGLKLSPGRDLPAQLAGQPGPWHCLSWSWGSSGNQAGNREETLLPRWGWVGQVGGTATPGKPWLVHSCSMACWAGGLKVWRWMRVGTGRALSPVSCGRHSSLSLSPSLSLVICQPSHQSCGVKPAHKVLEREDGRGNLQEW